VAIILKNVLNLSARAVDTVMLAMRLADFSSAFFQRITTSVSVAGVVVRFIHSIKILSLNTIQGSRSSVIPSARMLSCDSRERLHEMSNGIWMRLIDMLIAIGKKSISLVEMRMVITTLKGNHTDRRIAVWFY
jgi:uncharacterized protein YhhL (DUF1145 family)